MKYVNQKSKSVASDVGAYQENQSRDRAGKLRFIIDYIQQHGYAPTIREIGAGVGLKSTSSVMPHMIKLFAEE